MDTRAPGRLYLLFAGALFLGAAALCGAAARRPRCQLPLDVVVYHLPASAVAERRKVSADWNKTLRMMSGVPGWRVNHGWQYLPLRLYPHERLVIMPGKDLIPGAPGKWLFAYEPTFWGKQRPVAIRSVRVNRSPRRIIFVAENGAEMTPAARRIESALITRVLLKARPQDSFALLTGGGQRIAVRFGSSRAELLAAAEQLAKAPPVPAEGEGIRDALLEATTWFRKPRPGDAIFVVTMGLEGRTPGFFGTLRNVATLGLAQKHQASFAQVRAAVLRAHIRVFGFQLGPSSYNSCPVSVCGVEELPNASNEATYFGSGGAPRLELQGLCATSFGEFALLEAEAGTHDDSPAARVKHFKGYAETMYEAASEYYVLRLSSTSKNLVIGLKPDVQNRFPWSFVFYQQRVARCAGH